MESFTFAELLLALMASVVVLMVIVCVVFWLWFEDRFERSDGDIDELRTMVVAHEMDISEIKEDAEDCVRFEEKGSG